MHRILIVDDEEMIRMGIKNSMPWDELEISEVYTAASAAEGLRIIGEYKPDILLTDIYMSSMNGIELIELAKNVSPLIRTIVLTGYNSFDYARDCLRLKVDEFLLKPVDEIELADAIKNVKNDIMISNVNLTDLRGRLQLEKGMQDAVAGRLKSVDVLWEFFPNMSISEFQLAIFPSGVVVEAENYSFNMTMIHSLCIDRLDGYGKGATFCDTDGSICVLLFSNVDGEKLHGELEHLQSLLKNNFDLSPDVFCSHKFSDIKSLQLVYTALRDDIGKHCTIKLNHETKENNITAFRRLLSRCVGDSEQLLYTFNSFTERLAESDFSDSMVRRLCFETACDIYFSYLKYVGEQDGESLNMFASSIINIPKEELFEATRNFIMNLHEKETADHHRLIENAKQYIRENLSENLTVKGIASHLFISPNYLSRLFKQVCDEGCNEYIIRKRMEQAKMLLLSTNLKTYQIAQTVGFNDNNYFSIAFKKHTGISPSQYRNRQ